MRILYAVFGLTWCNKEPIAVPVAVSLFGMMLPRPFEYSGGLVKFTYRDLF